MIEDPQVKDKYFFSVTLGRKAMIKSFREDDFWHYSFNKKDWIFYCCCFSNNIYQTPMSFGPVPEGGVWWAVTRVPALQGAAVKWRESDTNPESRCNVYVQWLRVGAMFTFSGAHLHCGSRGAGHLFWVSELVPPSSGEVILSKSCNLPGMMVVDLDGFSIGNGIV